MRNLENPKRQQIVSTAKSLFLKFGIRRVSIEEICREAHVSKMTFYKHFNNKVDLAIFIYDQMNSEAMAKYQHIMHADIPFTEKVRKSIQLKMDQTKELSQEFLTDFYINADSELIEFFNKKVHESIQIITKDYIEAQKNGFIRPDIKPQFILYFLNHIFDMAKDEKLINLYDSAQELIMELTNFFFYGIMPRNQNVKEVNNA